MISHWILLQSENTPCVVLFFRLLKLVLWSKLLSFLVNISWALKKNSTLLDQCSIYVNEILLFVCSDLYPCLFSICSVSYWGSKGLNFSTILGFSLLFQLCQFLLRIFWDSIVWYGHIWIIINSCWIDSCINI